MTIRNMSIAVRLTAGFSAIAALLLMLGMFALQELKDMRSEALEVNTLWMPAMKNLSAFNQNFMRIRVFTLRALQADNGQELQAIESQIAGMENSLTQAERAISALALAPVIQAEFPALEKELTRYRQPGVLFERSARHS